MVYAATIDDATTYASPWTISFPIPRYRGERDPEIWEAACHEGNRAVAPLLQGEPMHRGLRQFCLAAIVVMTCGVTTAVAQGTAYRAPRTADGKPDLQGIWQVLNTAAWDIQDHSGQ